MLIYHCVYKALKGEEAGSHRETIRTTQQPRTRKARLSPCTAEAHVRIHWALKALGHSQRTVDLFIECLAYSQPQQYTKKQCALSELHLRKHLGTGQGPAAEGSCH